MKVGVSRYIDRPQPHFENFPGYNPPAIARISQVTHDKRFKLPKINLQKFSGDLKEWLLFWSLFKSIPENPTIANEDKFQYLI